MNLNKKTKQIGGVIVINEVIEKDKKERKDKKNIHFFYLKFYNITKHLYYKFESRVPNESTILIKNTIKNTIKETIKKDMQSFQNPVARTQTDNILTLEPASPSPRPSLKQHNDHIFAIISAGCKENGWTTKEIGDD
jgi:hypothetical protein